MKDQAQEGFTLLELMIVIPILGSVIAVVSTFFVLAFKSSSEAQARIDEANGSRLVRNYFSRDIMSSTSTTTASTCGAGVGALVFAASWTDGSAYEVAYRYTSGTLTRVQCETSPSTRVLATDLHSQPVFCAGECSASRLTLDVTPSSGAVFVLAVARRVP